MILFFFLPFFFLLDEEDNTMFNAMHLGHINVLVFSFIKKTSLSKISLQKGHSIFNLIHYIF